MKHFVSLLNDSVKNNWDLPAVTNFGANTYTYGQMAELMAKYQFHQFAMLIVKNPLVKKRSSLCRVHVCALNCRVHLIEDYTSAHRITYL